jgi:hypothetical protein
MWTRGSLGMVNLVRSMNLKYNLQTQEAFKKRFQKKLRGDLRFILWNEILLLWVHLFLKNFFTSLKYSSHGETHLWLFWSLFTTSIIKEEPLCPSGKKPTKLSKEEIHHPCLLVEAKNLNLSFFYIMLCINRPMHKEFSLWRTCICA